MLSEQAARLRAAYRTAVAALDELRAALLEAGVLEAEPAQSAAPAPVAESAEDRRRRLARERARQFRARNAASVTHNAESVTEALRERYAVTPERYASVTERDASVTQASRAHAFLIEEDLSNTPLFATQTPSPHSAERYAPAVPVAPVDEPAVAPVARLEPAPTAPVAPPAGEEMPRERPARRRGRANGTSPGSPAVRGAERAPEGAAGGPVSDADRVWSAYVEAVAPTRPRRTVTRNALIERRLREYTVDELERAVRGYGRSPFHRGENDRGRPYQALELWLRDAAHVEAGWSYLDKPATPPRAAPKKGAPELDGVTREWQEYESRLAAEKAEADRDVFAEL